jgi:transposase
MSLMSGRSKHYSKQFKKDAVTYVREHDDLSVNAAAKNLGVAASTLGKWVEKADGGKEIHRGSGNYSSDEAKENARLRKELRDTRDALEILKKAISILGD